MTVLPAVVLPAPELEDDELLALALGDDLRGDRRALHERLTDLRGVAAADHQHLAEVDLVALLAGELLDANRLPFAHSVLLAARLDDRVHGCLEPLPAGA